jgi:hypothetical protein
LLALLTYYPVCSSLAPCQRAWGGLQRSASLILSQALSFHSRHLDRLFGPVNS